MSKTGWVVVAGGARREHGSRVLAPGPGILGWEVASPGTGVALAAVLRTWRAWGKQNAQAPEAGVGRLLLGLGPGQAAPQAEGS